MATVRLGRYELEEYDLPKVCMRCGARASHYKSRKFQWHPPWAFFVLGALGAMIFAKTVTMPVPLCEKHKWHWGGRTAFLVVGLIAFVVLSLGAAAALGDNEDLAPIAFGVLGVLFLGWLIGAVVLASTTIRPKEITDKSVTLTGVSEEFAAALNEARRGEEEGDEGARPRRRRGRDDDEDERPRAKRRAAEEDEGGYYDPGAKRRRRPPPDAYEEGDDRR